jgi:hypothetical protein
MQSYSLNIIIHKKQYKCFELTFEVNKKQIFVSKSKENHLLFIKERIRIN